MTIFSTFNVFLSNNDKNINFMDLIKEYPVAKFLPELPMRLT
jgi:hypothetical protein